MRRLWAALALFAGVLLWLLLPLQKLKSFEAVKKDYQRLERNIFDRQGKFLLKQRLSQTSRRLDWIERGDVPGITQRAIIQVEDKRFYEHAGVDVWALAGLPYSWMRTGKIRGASTLSMQLTSLLDGKGSVPKKSLVQKLRQIFNAWRLERSWSKEQILEAYLNLVPFRSNLEGLQAASQGLFQKDPHGLNEVESFALASLIASPNASVERIIRKVCHALKQDNCQRVQNDLAKAFAQRPRLMQPDNIAPHFLTAMKKDGETIHITLDAGLQSLANEAVADQIASLESQNVHDASVLVADYRTGEVLVYVGSSGKYSKAAEVDGVMAKRQAGSTLKPFLYAEALDEKLMTADTLLLDKAIQIQTPNGIYAPQNYDESYRGVVSVREALASSLNIPAVRVIEMLGIDPFYSILERLGFSLASRQTYGHSLALGSLDVSLWQLVKAYGVLARGGSDWQMTLDRSLRAFHPPRNILGTLGTSVVSKILSDKDSRASTFSLDNVLATPYWTAAKTGTSKDMRDNWCLGYSDKYVVGVWVGNFDGSPMWSVSGVTGAAPIWRRMMDQLHGQSLANESFPVPMSAGESGAKSALKLRQGKTILYPMDKTVIAFDPDIPDAQQILVFESEEALPRNYFWKLDGIERKGGFVKLTELRSGLHTLEIADSDQRALARVQFEMRGNSGSNGDQSAL